MEPSDLERLDATHDDRREPGDPAVVSDAAFDEAMEAVLDEHAATLRSLTT